MTQHDVSAALLAPDFYHYSSAPIAAVTEGDDALVVSWSDGRQLSCHRFWLRENTLGHGGIDPATREGIMDPAELSDSMQISAFELSDSGDLCVIWSPEGTDESVISTYHSGWLRHIAEGQHLVVLDMADLDYISSAGLRVIFKAAKQLKAEGRSLCVANRQAQIAKVFEILQALLQRIKAAGFRRVTLLTQPGEALP